MPSIWFLSVDDVLAIHEDTIANEGGLAGIRDPGLLESAVLMPQQQFGGEHLHAGLPAMAAAYPVSLRITPSTTATSGRLRSRP